MSRVDSPPPRAMKSTFHTDPLPGFVDLVAYATWRRTEAPRPIGRDAAACATWRSFSSDLAHLIDLPALPDEIGWTRSAESKCCTRRLEQSAAICASICRPSNSWSQPFAVSILRLTKHATPK